jgi:hypothetical protein
VRLTFESSYRHAMDLDDEGLAIVKRKRVSDAGTVEEVDIVGLHTEIKRLRKGYEDKEARLRQLEETVRALQQSTQR